MNSLTKTANRLALIAFVASSALFVSSASAQTTGAQFAPTGSIAYTGTGALGETFVEFTGPEDINYPNNSYSGSTEALTGGVSLTVTPTVTTGADSYFSNSGSGGSTSNFFDNFLASNGSGFTYQLSGLTAGGTYDLALYASDLGGRPGDNPTSFTVNGTALPYTVGPTNGGGAFIQQTATQTGNYELVNNVIANASGDINIASAAGGPNNGYSEINGIGITSVPEPSAWALMLAGVGAIVSLQVLRRRNT